MTAPPKKRTAKPKRTTATKAAPKAQGAGSTEGKDAATGKFIPGNKFWLLRSSAGPKPKFSCPDKLWAACCEYFEWVDENPLFEDKLVTYMGNSKHEPTARMRAMTIDGLCLFLDIDKSTWFDWGKNRADLSSVITQAENVIRSQKFAGAAADLLNANIIARDLGLSDKQELTGRDGGPIRTVDESNLNDVDKALELVEAAIANLSQTSSGD